MRRRPRRIGAPGRCRTRGNRACLTAAPPPQDGLAARTVGDADQDATGQDLDGLVVAASTDSEAVEHGGGLHRAGRPAMFPDMAWVEVEGDGVPLALATADRHDGGTWVAIFRWVHPAHRGAG